MDKDYEEWENEIAGKIDSWHNGDSKLTPEEYLGMSDLEYRLFINKPYKYWCLYIKPFLFSR